MTETSLSNVPREPTWQTATSPSTDANPSDSVASPSARVGNSNHLASSCRLRFAFWLRMGFWKALHIVCSHQQHCSSSHIPSVYKCTFAKIFRTLNSLQFQVSLGSGLLQCPAGSNRDNVSATLSREQHLRDDWCSGWAVS